MSRKILEDERRNKRISLAVTPSIYDSVLAMAQIRKMSVNDFLIEVISKIAQKNSNVIADFKKASETAGEKFVDSVD